MDPQVLLTLLRIIFLAAVFVYGVVIGSFLNVVIYRVPLDRTVAHGRSECTSCHHQLIWRDLIPVFSYLSLRGKCRYCGARISPRYITVELLNGLLWLAYAAVFGFSLETLCWIVIASCLVCVVFIDAEHMIIPDRFNIIISVAGALLFLTPAMPWYERLIGAFTVSGLFLIIALVSRGRTMGGGDIKLMAAAGLALGWKSSLVALMLAALVGAVVSVILLRRSFAKTGEGAHMVPFGPYLALGSIAASFFGGAIADWYTSLL